MQKETQNLTCSSSSKTRTNTMKTTTTNRTTKPLMILLSLFLSLIFIIFLFSDQLLSLQQYQHMKIESTFNTVVPGRPSLQNQNHASSSSNLSMRHGFNTTYDSYLQHQLNKTLNPKLRKLWVTRDWERKIKVFSKFFNKLKTQNLLSDDSKSLCIGARVGQEVAALKQVGVSDSVGIDLVPFPPLVIQGDFHDQPFKNSTFDFEFSNVFDHALYPSKFVGEIERTLKPGGVCVLHVAVSKRGDKYSANDLFNVDGLIGLFRVCDVVHVRKIDGFGLDTEIVLRKRRS